MNTKVLFVTSQDGEYNEGTWDSNLLAQIPVDGGEQDDLLTKEFQNDKTQVIVAIMNQVDHDLDYAERLSGDFGELCSWEVVDRDDVPFYRSGDPQSDDNEEMEQKWQKLQVRTWVYIPEMKNTDAQGCFAVYGLGKIQGPEATTVNGAIAVNAEPLWNLLSQVEDLVDELKQDQVDKFSEKRRGLLSDLEKAKTAYLENERVVLGGKTFADVGDIEEVIFLIRKQIVDGRLDRCQDDYLHQDERLWKSLNIPVDQRMTVTDVVYYAHKHMWEQRLLKNN